MTGECVLAASRASLIACRMAGDCQRLLDGAVA